MMGRYFGPRTRLRGMLAQLKNLRLDCTPREQPHSCCVVADPAKDLRMRGAFEDDEASS